MIAQLRYLLRLATEQHFGRAAEACGVTQPTLSAGIRALEATLGVLLVRRGSRYQGLTPEGDAVLVWARRIVADERALYDEVRALRSGVTGHLRLGVIPTALTGVADLTAPFTARYPAVTFSILSRTSKDILDGLDDLHFDAGITYLDAEPIGRVRTLPLYAETYCAVTQASARFLGQDAIHWHELDGVPLCLLTSDMQNRRIIERKLREAGVVPNVAVDSESLTVLLTHARSRPWTAILPAVTGLDLGADARTRIVPIIETGAAPLVGLVYPTRDPLMPALAALVASLSHTGR